MRRLDKNLKILIGIGLISIIAIGVLGIHAQLEIEKLTPAGMSNLKTKAPIEKKATLITELPRSGSEGEDEDFVLIAIDDGTRNPQTFKLKVNEKSTAFDLLKQTGLDLDYTEYDTGVFVEKIGEKENGQEGKYWLYYVNGEMPMVSVDKNEIKSGDKVEFKFEKSPF